MDLYSQVKSLIFTVMSLWRLEGNENSIVRSVKIVLRISNTRIVEFQEDICILKRTSSEANITSSCPLKIETADRDIRSAVMFRCDRDRNFVIKLGIWHHGSRSKEQIERFEVLGVAHVIRVVHSGETSRDIYVSEFASYSMYACGLRSLDTLINYRIKNFKRSSSSTVMRNKQAVLINKKDCSQKLGSQEEKISRNIGGTTCSFFKACGLLKNVVIKIRQRSPPKKYAHSGVKEPNDGKESQKGEQERR